MHPNAFPVLLLLGSLAFAAIPSAFLARSAWRAGGWRRAAASILALLILSLAIGFALSSPLSFDSQFEASMAAISVWYAALALLAMIWMLWRIASSLLRRFSPSRGLVTEVSREQAPNPSIERTAAGKPSSAAHIKR
jgi:hypothetical protein